MRTAYSLKLGMEDLATKYEQLTIPVIACHGHLDKVTYIGGTKKLLDKCGSTDKTLHEFEKGYHVLLEGPEKDEVFGKVSAWIMERFPAKANM